MKKGPELDTDIANMPNAPSFTGTGTLSARPGEGVSVSRAHTHPVQAESEVKTEAASPAVEAGDEGCREHYDEREIVTDVNYGLNGGAGGVRKKRAVAKDILRLITFGEALAAPRSKNPYRFGKK